jgi:DNA-binding NarL/FixJ family response regulator
LSNLNTYQCLVADDHAIIRQGLMMLLSNLTFDITFLEAEDKLSLYESLSNHNFDLLILDLNFEESNALLWIVDIVAQYPDLKVVIFSSFDKHVYAARVLQLGAKAFISKTAPPNEILKTVNEVLTNQFYPLPKQSHPLSTLELLSGREMEIALLLAKGYGNLEISNELGIKSNTISTYKLRIFEKLNIKTTKDLLEIIKIN